VPGVWNNHAPPVNTLRRWCEDGSDCLVTPSPQRPPFSTDECGWHDAIGSISSDLALYLPLGRPPSYGILDSHPVLSPMEDLLSLELTEPPPQDYSKNKTDQSFAQLLSNTTSSSSCVYRCRCRRPLGPWVCPRCEKVS